MNRGVEAFLEASAQALTLVAVITLGLFVLSLLLKAVTRRGQSRARRGAAPDPRSRRERAVEQVRTVEDSGFERRPLLNSEEARLLPVLERAARELGQGHRVMAQTSLGEVIRPTDRNDWAAQAAINAKRLDFAIIDRWGMLACAVEYHGTGHYQDSAALRDTVKREALRKAGVRMIEVHPGFSPEDLRREVGGVLGGHPAG